MYAVRNRKSMKKYGVQFYSRAFPILLLIQLITFLNTSVSSNHHGNSRIRSYTNKSCPICDLYNISENSRFIKLALLIDNSNSSTDRHSSEIEQFCLTITDKVNEYFHPVNISVALVEVEVWNESTSKNVMDTNISQMYHNFENYAQPLFKKEIDHVQLISSYAFEKDFIPFNITNKMCNSSIGIIGNHSNNETIIAKHLSYVLAYNMGIDPNYENCRDINLMQMLAIGSKSLKENAYKWNSCAIESIERIITDKERFPCLNDEPIKLFDRPVCGNGLLETGEDCDCGSTTDKCDSCCNSSTCKFGSSICNLKITQQGICIPSKHDGSDMNLYLVIVLAVICSAQFVFCIVYFTRKSSVFQKFYINVFRHRPARHAVPNEERASTLHQSVTNSHPIEFTRHACTSEMQNECGEMSKNASRLNKDSLLKNTITKNIKQSSTAIAHSSPQVDSFSGGGNELYELNAISNIYEEVLPYEEKNQQGENISEEDYGYIACSSCSTTSSGYMIPTATNSGSQQNIENDDKISVPEEWAPGYHKPFNKPKKIPPLFLSSLNNQLAAVLNHSPIPPPRPDLRATPRHLKEDKPI